MGKSLEEVAEDMNIPYSTVRKWENRNPHDKYKSKINQYLNEHRSYLTPQIDYETDVSGSGVIIPPEIAVDIDPYTKNYAGYVSILHNSFCENASYLFFLKVDIIWPFQLGTRLYFSLIILLYSYVSSGFNIPRVSGNINLPIFSFFSESNKKIT